MGSCIKCSWEKPLVLPVLPTFSTLFSPGGPFVKFFCSDPRFMDLILKFSGLKANVIALKKEWKYNQNEIIQEQKIFYIHKLCIKIKSVTKSLTLNATNTLASANSSQFLN